MIISGLLALVVGLFAYSVLMPRNIDSFNPNIQSSGKDNRMLRIASLIGNELYASLPNNVSVSRKNNTRIESLLVRSGNPWNLTAQEFSFFQFVTAFIGFVSGWIVLFLLSFQMNIAWWIPVLGLTILGFMTPRLKYNDQAKKRDLDFKRQLPEALDLIIISLSGGRTFPQAVRDSIPNMKEGVLKEEFKEIINGIDTGKTLSETLDQFSSRSPNESIKTFVQAVREASELDVSLAEVLESRAEASRAEFFALIHNKTAQLSSKMMAVLVPTLLPALIIVLVTPSIASLLGSLGGG